jgi:hypothetical protein
LPTGTCWGKEIHLPKKTTISINGHAPTPVPATADQCCVRQNRGHAAFAERARYEVAGTYKETASGVKLDRAEWRKLMVLIRTAKRPILPVDPVTQAILGVSGSSAGDRFGAALLSKTASAQGWAGPDWQHYAA